MTKHDWDVAAFIASGVFFVADALEVPSKVGLQSVGLVFLALGIYFR